jgi:MYXO-CTERM domain-containing protein
MTGIRLAHETSPARRARWSVALSLGLSVFATAEVASAFPTFPGYLQNTLQMECAPTCLLCHTDPEGERDTVKMGAPLGGARGEGVFVQNLIVHAAPMSISGSATNPSEAQLAAALQALRMEPCDRMAGTSPCDSDGDGKFDVDELVANQDPDDSQADAPLCIGPRYGCGAHVAATPASKHLPDATALLAAFGVALVLVRRRRA